VGKRKDLYWRETEARLRIGPGDGSCYSLLVYNIDRFQNVPEGRAVDVPVHRAIRIELGVIECVERFEAVNCRNQPGR
jgi:hypothetical protein